MTIFVVPGDREFQIMSSQDVFEVMSEMVSNVKEGIDCCFDAITLPVALRIVLFNENKLKDLKSRNVKLRCITEITENNLFHCKQILKYFELFHYSRLKGSFMIADQQRYVFYIANKKGEEKLLEIMNPSFVATQQFLINTLIDKGLSARQRISEIGRGIENEFIETIRDPDHVKTIIMDLIGGAIYEIAILFSTKNSFLIAEREGILEKIGQVSKQGIKVKILVMQDEVVKEISNTRLKVPHHNIQVNYLQQFLPTRITTFIIDQTKCLTIEVKDDTRWKFKEAIGLSTYSNSESTVFSNASIFESLWIQSELDKQNKTKQAYFQLFKGFKLKDEVYNRRWSLGRQNEKEKTE